MTVCGWYNICSLIYCIIDGDGDGDGCNCLCLSGWNKAPLVVDGDSIVDIAAAWEKGDWEDGVVGCEEDTANSTEQLRCWVYQSVVSTLSCSWCVRSLVCNWMINEIELVGVAWIGRDEEIIDSNELVSTHVAIQTEREKKNKIYSWQTDRK